jgi:hypothetical protein
MLEAYVFVTRRWSYNFASYAFRTEGELGLRSKMRSFWSGSTIRHNKTVEVPLFREKW